MAAGCSSIFTPQTRELQQFSHLIPVQKANKWISENVTLFLTFYQPVGFPLHAADTL